MNYKYEPFYKQYEADYANVVKAVNNVERHSVSNNICPQLRTAIDNLESIQSFLSNETKDKVVVSFYNVVTSTLGITQQIYEFLDNDYMSVERVYQELKVALEELQSKDSELEVLCGDPPRQSQFKTTDGEDDVEKYKRRLHQWHVKVIFLKKNCQDLKIRIDDYFRYLNSIGHCQAINGSSNNKVPSFDKVSSRYNAYNSILDVLGENKEPININEGKRVYTDDELEHVRSWDQNYLDKYHNYEEWTFNYLEALIVSEHSDRSFAALEYAYINKYINEEQYNYLKNPNNYSELVEKVEERRALRVDVKPVEIPNNLEQQKAELNESYPETRFVNTKNSTLRLRQLPNMESNILANLPKGTSINVGEKTEDGWRAAYAVVNNQIVKGWVKEDFISEDNPYSSSHLRDFDPTDHSIYHIEGEIAAMNALKDVENV